MGRFHIWLTSRICSIHSQVVDFQHTCCIVLHCCFSAVGRCTKSRRIRREKYAAAGVTYVLYVKFSLVKAYPSQTTAQVGEVSPSIYHIIYIIFTQAIIVYIWQQPNNTIHTVHFIQMLFVSIEKTRVSTLNCWSFAQPLKRWFIKQQYLHYISWMGCV